MLHLHTFGGCRISRDGVRLDALASQQKALALLAVLATHSSGVSRETVLAYLWPESDDERARTALRQLVRVLRSKLGTFELVEGAAVMRLGPDAATSDVGQFRDALAAGNDEAAIALYTGPFLDGFHVRSAHGFQDWVERQRTELAEEWSRAITRLADRAARRDEHAHAAVLWRRLAAANPLASIPALGLMRALDAAGDRPAALQHARIHAALVRQELGADPDPAVSTLAKQLSAPTATVAAAGLSDSELASQSSPDVSVLTTPAWEAQHEATPAAVAAVQRASPPSRRWWHGSGVFAVIFLVAGALALGIATFQRSRESSPYSANTASDGRDASAVGYAADSLAQTMYRSGRHAFHNRIDESGIRQAIRYFQTAVDRDRLYAPGHAGLADGYIRLAAFGYADPQTMLRRAKDEALRAVALDSGLAEGRAALAHALMLGDYAWDAAEHEFKHALARQPDYMFARAPFAILLASRGRYNEALAQLDTAEAAEPLAPWIANVRGRVLVAAGRPRDAVRVLEGVLTLYPSVDMAYQQLGHAYLALGFPERAVAAMRRGAAMHGARDSAHLAYAYAVTGKRDAALQIVHTLSVNGKSTDRGVASDLLAFHLAMVHTALGDHDAAFRQLERGRDIRAPFMIGTALEPAFKKLHADPRWLPLLLSLGFPREFALR